MSGHQIAAAIADDGIREYRVTGGWWESGLEAAADVLCQCGHGGLFRRGGKETPLDIICHYRKKIQTIDRDIHWRNS